MSPEQKAHYYELPTGATELQDLISYRNMNAQIGEIFRTCYRYGQAAHSDQLRPRWIGRGIQPCTSKSEKSE